MAEFPALHPSKHTDGVGAPGRIQISGDTTDRLPASYRLEAWGTVEIRNRDPLDTRFHLEWTPVFRDGFVDSWDPIVGFPFSFLIRFDRDSSDAVVGCRVSGDRVRNLRFLRVGAG